MNEAGFQPDVIEAVPAHADTNQTRAAYTIPCINGLRWWTGGVKKSAEPRGVQYCNGIIYDFG